MEALRMKLFVVVAIVAVTLIEITAFHGVSAAEAPAPSPTSDASVFVPTAIASVLALAFGFLI
ncbi:arabinogalactan protein 21-like [Impatiens glandulifera]|uniref:arabinogalactan protein 21-like n=1 Tax=Impatiens glandulifera TaxID=253017 RepID=UPI001FB172EA|nr:arabinogalactan protein 21-like [Impatiens glandulifera]